MTREEPIALLEKLLAENGHDQTMRREAIKALVGSGPEISAQQELTQRLGALESSEPPALGGHIYPTTFNHEITSQ